MKTIHIPIPTHFNKTTKKWKIETAGVNVILVGMNSIHHNFIVTFKHDVEPSSAGSFT
jgi:hypothetical protein